MKIFLCQDSWHEKDVSATPAIWETKLNEAMENMMRKGPMGIASAPKVDGSVLRTQFDNTKVSRSNASVSM
jgi:hypothetical protein